MFGHKRIPSREGGVEVVVEELSKRMVQMGHNVTCYNRRGHHVCGEVYDSQVSTQTYQGIQICTVPTFDKKGLAAVTASITAAIKATIDDSEIVHIHAEGPSFMCWLPKLFGKKVIVTVHGLDHQRAKWGHFARTYIMWGEKNAARFADNIIVLSKNVQDYFLQNYSRETVLIPNGVIKHTPVKGDIIYDKYALNKDDYILYLGRLVPEKGLEYLINAFKNVKTQKRLVIAGGSSDTCEFEEKLHRLAQDDERIIFTGFVQGEMLSELYSNAYIYVLPSNIEGMPLSLLEAMSYGNCCLTSDIPECKDVIGDMGVTFQQSNVDDLQRKIQYLCNNCDKVKFMKNGSQKYICDKYNWDAVVSQTLDVYRK